MRPLVIDRSAHRLTQLVIYVRDRVVADVHVILEIDVAVVEAQEARVPRWDRWLLRHLPRSVLRWPRGTLDGLAGRCLLHAPGARLIGLLSVPESLHVVVVKMRDKVLSLVVGELVARRRSRRHLRLSQRQRVTIVLQVGKHHGTLPYGRRTTIRQHTLRRLAGTRVRLPRSLRLRRRLLLLFLRIL